MVMLGDEGAAFAGRSRELIRAKMVWEEPHEGMRVWDNL